MLVVLGTGNAKMHKTSNVLWLQWKCLICLVSSSSAVRSRDRLEKLVFLKRRERLARAMMIRHVFSVGRLSGSFVVDFLRLELINILVLS